ARRRGPGRSRPRPVGRRRTPRATTPVSPALRSRGAGLYTRRDIANGGGPMRAAVLWQWNEPFTVEDVTLAKPREGEGRVKLAASGVCHSDLSIQRGTLPMPPPRIIGHEGAGVVEEIGPGVTSVAPGDHVILCWMYPCGHCVECGRGRPAHCESALATMMGGGAAHFKVKGQDMPHWVGSFAE